MSARRRVRELGIAVGRLPVGPQNAITDVSGVRVGYSTLVRDEPVVVRTGVTAIWPAGDDIWTWPVFAGHHSFNGNGEMTGTAWLAEQGLLATPIAITNTHCVGAVRDAICAYASEKVRAAPPWLLPVAAETYDGVLSASETQPVFRGMVFEALDRATDAGVREGNVGGGTGMICHEFKGGTGTSSRTVAGHTVGALVQANYGRRCHLTVDGVPVGREIDFDEVPAPALFAGDAGSIIVVLATDAPLLPIQCQRLARRATVGLGKVGGIGANGSGDLFIAFSTANRIALSAACHDVKMTGPTAMTALFEAAIEAVEEAILNALTMAETMTGRDGNTAHALPTERLVEIMSRFARLGPAARAGGTI